MTKDLIWLKKEYEKVKQKYNLPGFDELNKEFEIERLCEHETELLARRLRRAITEKVIHMLRLLEYFVNPQGAPLFIHSIMNNFDDETKKLIEKLYESGCKLETRSLALDISSDDEKDIKFIKEMLAVWKTMKKDIEKLNDKIDAAWSPKEGKQERRGNLVG